MELKLTRQDFVKTLNNQQKFYKFMKDIQEKRISALKAKIKKCTGCGICCYSMPCDLEYDDIGKIALYLNISKKEFFNKYLTFQYYINLKKFTVIPIRKGQEDIAGKIKPITRWHDTESCIFLNSENRCKIQESKPLGGKKINCWEDCTPENSGIFWEENEIENLIKEYK